MRGLSDFVSLFVKLIEVAGPLVVMIHGTRPAHQLFRKAAPAELCRMVLRAALEALTRPLHLYQTRIFEG